MAFANRVESEKGLSTRRKNDDHQSRHWSVSVCWKFAHCLNPGSGNSVRHGAVKIERCSELPEVFTDQ